MLILHLDAHHLIAEGTVDVLAAALQGRVVGRVHRVDRHGPTPAPVEGVQLDVAGPHLPRGRRHGGGGCSGCTGSRLRHADGMGGGGEACVGAPPSHGLLLRRVLPGGRLAPMLALPAPATAAAMPRRVLLLVVLLLLLM